MKLDPTKFGTACALGCATFWLITSIIFIGIPLALLFITGAETAMAMQGAIGFGVIVLGLLAWGFLGGMTGWMIATLYNKQLE